MIMYLFETTHDMSITDDLEGEDHRHHEEREVDEGGLIIVSDQFVGEDYTPSSVQDVHHHTGSDG